ncbi:NACHT domain-containing protein [Streptomyces sp. NPDC054841]
MIVLLAVAHVIARAVSGDFLKETTDLLALGVGAASVLLGVLAFRTAERQDELADRNTPVILANLAQRVAEREKPRRSLLTTGGGAEPPVIDLAFRRTSPDPVAGDAARPPDGGTQHRIAEFWDVVPSRVLVISGEAGMGKTTLAHSLVQSLLNRHSGISSVPVVVSAASWNMEADGGFAGWLVRLLVRQYGLRRAEAEHVVAGGHVIPVVDGMDEIASADTPDGRQRLFRAVRGLNAYRRSRLGGAPLIVTCRSGHLRMLDQERITLAEAVQIAVQPVAMPQVRAYLAKADNDATLARWQPVLTAAEGRPEGPVARTLANPWRLHMIATVYTERHTRGGYYLERDQGLRGRLEYLSALAEEVAISSYLTRHYIDARIRAAPGGLGWAHDLDRVRRWLAELATWTVVGRDVLAFSGPVRSGPGWRYLGERVPGRHEWLVPYLGTDLVLRDLSQRAHMRVQHCAKLMAAVAYGLPLVLLVHVLYEPLLRRADWPGNVWPWLAIAVTAACIAAVSTFEEPQRGRLGLERRPLPTPAHRLLSWGATVAAGALGLAVGLLVALNQPGKLPDGTPVKPLSPVDAVLIVVLFVLLFGAFSLWGWVRFRTGDQMPWIPPSWMPGRRLFVSPDAAFAGRRPSKGPRYELRAELITGLVLGLLFPVLVASCWLVLVVDPGPPPTIPRDLVPPAWYWLTWWLAGFVACSGELTRYAAFVICADVPRRLPWRLAAFTHWIYKAGLMRVSGDAYQFRHRELQEWLYWHSLGDVSPLLTPPHRPGSRSPRQGSSSG